MGSPYTYYFKEEEEFNMTDSGGGTGFDTEKEMMGHVISSIKRMKQLYGELTVTLDIIEKPLFINEKSERFIKCFECKCSTNSAHTVKDGRVLCLKCAC